MMLLAQTADQQTQWQLQMRWPWPAWLTVLFVVGVVLAIGYLYARESSPASTAYRSLLALLRLTTIGLVLVMLSELLFSATRSGLPRLVVLVDHSGSMAIDDVADQSRLDAARELLLANNAEWLRRWRDRYELVVVAVADSATPLDGDTPDELVASIESLRTTGEGTTRSRLGDAVIAALDVQDGSPPAAVVLATDGRTTAGRSLDEARGVARERGVPVYALGYGATSPPPDLRLTNLLADSSAFVGDRVAIGVTLEANSAAGQQATVRVRDIATDNVVAEQKVEITGEAFSKSAQLVVRPESRGTTTYAIEVAPLANERNADNNRLVHSIDVRDDQIRVLLAAGYPCYEFRYLKNLLARDSAFQVQSYLQEADLDYVQQDSTAIGQLPVATDALDDVDVVVMIDLNPRLVPPRWWQNVERHVAEQGGGLVLVAGPRYFPWQYAGTPTLTNLAPIVVSSAGRIGGEYDTGFRLQLTQLGRDSPAMQLGASPAESEAIWQALPPFYWYAAASQLKPAAQVLAIHPTARTSTGSPMPLIVSQYVGAGRVLYHGVDSTWRWRLGVGDVFFARYWGQSLRQLARNKRLGDQAAAEIVLQRSEYPLGQPVQLGLRVSGKQRAAIAGDAQLLLTADGQPQRRIALAPSRLAAEQLQATVSDLPPGRYRVTAPIAGLAEPPQAVEFSVVAPPGELTDVTMNRQALLKLAEATYGKFYTAQTANQLADDLPTGERVPLEVLPPKELWNQWWMLAAITACLSTEWILRKRRAML